MSSECADCAHWLPVSLQPREGEEREGVCRRYPATLFLVQAEASRHDFVLSADHYSQPWTRQWDTCGEHKPRK